MSWFGETLHLAHGYAQHLEILAEIVHERTAFQDLLILDTKPFGRVLVLDGIVQTTERDEFIYHEMLTHVPLLAHGNAKRVLIIGGGDGGMLREVLRHPVEQVVMVEIDGLVVERCRQHMPKLSAGAFEDPRAKVLIDDGIAYVAASRDRFDVIIVDSTDPMGPGEVLFTEEFYGNCRRLLGEDGIIITQSGVPFFQGPEMAAGAERLKVHFRDVGFLLISVPSYAGGMMALGWASQNGDHRRLSEAVIAERFQPLGIRTGYYSPAMHVRAFALPPFIAALIA